jgi:hypothetical protein
MTDDSWQFAREARARHFPADLPGGYRCDAVDADTYWEAYERALRDHFADEVYFRGDLLARPDAAGARERLAGVMDAALLSDCWLVRAPDGSLAGAFAGLSRVPRAYLQLHSTVHTDHRRRGLYSEMTGRLLRYTAELGFECVESMHAPSNNAILIAKLGLGFRLVGVEVAPGPGWSVKLCYFHSEAAARVYEYRCGIASLDEESFAAAADNRGMRRLAEQIAHGRAAAAGLGGG